MFGIIFTMLVVAATGPTVTVLVIRESFPPSTAAIVGGIAGLFMMAFAVGFWGEWVDHDRS